MEFVEKRRKKEANDAERKTREDTERERMSRKGNGVKLREKRRKCRGRRKGNRRGRPRKKIRGGKEVKQASNLITQINVAWREQLPKWTKKTE